MQARGEECSGQRVQLRFPGPAEDICFFPFRISVVDIFLSSFHNTTDTDCIACQCIDHSIFDMRDDTR